MRERQKGKMKKGLTVLGERYAIWFCLIPRVDADALSLKLATTEKTRSRDM